MSNGRREEIIAATLELAAEKGLGNVSMNMIAEKVGIKKPSLYNHFSSKEEIVEAMYHYLREKAKANNNIANMDYGALLEGRTALEVLQLVTDNYRRMNSDGQMQVFYKVIYSERYIQSAAAQIMAWETEKMVLATKHLFYAMQIHKVLHFDDPDMSAVTFAMTIHGLMEYDLDCQMAEKDRKNAQIQSYLEWFCKENEVK